MSDVVAAQEQELARRRVRAIVVGGSAGGLEALRVLLPGLPAPLGVPVLVVLHVSADAKNAWSLLFERSLVHVLEPEDKDLALPGNVYIAPPNYHMLVDASGRLQLSVDERVHFARPSIDVLFESAAFAYGPHVLGILLSGANADGAAGLSAIARAGGATWVQAPETATARMMPKSAIDAVPGAAVLTPAEMARALRAAPLAPTEATGAAEGDPPGQVVSGGAPQAGQADRAALDGEQR